MHHVVLEMYAGGNVILTDGAGLILTLLRPYTVEEGRVAVGQTYPMNGTPDPDPQPDAIASYLGEFVVKQAAQDAAAEDDDDEGEDEDEEKARLQHRRPTTVKGAVEAPRPTRKSKDKKKKLRDKEKAHLRELAQALTAKGSPVQALGPVLVAHCLVRAAIDPTEAVSAAMVERAGGIAASLREAGAVLGVLRDGAAALPGFVTVQAGGLYDGYEPMEFASADDATLSQPPRQFPSFHAAVDEFYSKVETQRQLKAAEQTEKAGLAKVESVRQQQQQRVDDLQRAVAERQRAAAVLAEHAVAADQAIGAINALLAAGMTWADVESVVQREKQAGNPVAALVRSLQLKDHQATLAIEDALVVVDLRLSAHANVSNTFAEKKRALKKVEVTEVRAKQVVEELASKVAGEAERRAPTQGIVLQRKPMWFERFHWFLTSEGVLVLGGRDMHQNEALVKRFLRAGDVFLHADIHGAPTCIVRNPRAANPVPPESLRQAGMFCVCRSSAWNAKVVTSAWWVHKEQVSKTAQSGEFLPTGSFVVRGKKNYLQPARLEMSFGYIFKLDTTADEGEPRLKEWRYLHNAQGGEPSEDEDGDDASAVAEPADALSAADVPAGADGAAAAAADADDSDAEEETDAAVAKADDEDEDDDVVVPTGGEDVLLGFTAAPRPNDMILYALPFCGPTASMVHFKFRVKLTPGAMKKGRASKQAVELFAKSATRREKDVMMTVTDPQNVAVMMGEVKVSAPGLEKVKAAKRRASKQVSKAAGESHQ